ncbi:uncharacterized [Tachysurus ichikawai]
MKLEGSDDTHSTRELPKTNFGSQKPPQQRWELQHPSLVDADFLMKSRQNDLKHSKRKIHHYAASRHTCQPSQWHEPEAKIMALAHWLEKTQAWLRRES